MKYPSALVLPLFLTACAGTNEEFDCKAKGGLGCKSVSYVHAAVDKGFLSPSEHEVEEDKISLKNFEQGAGGFTWIAPYEDENGSHPEYVGGLFL
ncbi:MAG TPA: hypothetical protein VI959_00570 [Alphaproteobacteria bacterium]|nr:hypothetical protein [Alphaproteobacteria bacterium]